VKEGQDFATCLLANGVEARVEVRSTLELRVGALAASLPYPDRGLAWVGLSASPSGRYVVLQHCSGQGEESYAVFDLRGGLSSPARRDYVYGETNSIGFDASERFAVAAIPGRCVEWWQGFEEVDGEDEAGRTYFDFGLLATHDLEQATCSETLLRIWAQDGWASKQATYDPLLKPRFASADSLEIALPWGRETFLFPLADVVWLRPPTT